MKKLGVISASLILFSSFALIPLVHGDPVEVSPITCNFGDVELWSSSTTIITITNNGYETYTITSVIFVAGSDSDFTITVNPEGMPLGNGQSAEVHISYTPLELGLASATLEIGWEDGMAGTTSVELLGTGVEASGPLTIEDILAFFDAGVAAGTIQGKGPSNDAKENHLKVFKLKLWMVAVFLGSGANREACTLLWHAYDRSDGQDQPKDFIKGQHVDELNAMILQLLSDLGCVE